MGAYDKWWLFGLMTQITYISIVVLLYVYLVLSSVFSVLFCFVLFE